MRLYMTELGVSDFNVSIAWWCELLQRQPTVLDEENGFALFDLGGGRLALKRKTIPGGGTVHFEVDVLPKGEVKTSDEGYRRVKLNDPDGNVVVLFEWTGNRRSSGSG